MNVDNKLQENVRAGTKCRDATLHSNRNVAPSKSTAQGYGGRPQLFRSVCVCAQMHAYMHARLQVAEREVRA